jgi:hypothetical protein
MKRQNEDAVDDPDASTDAHTVDRIAAISGASASVRNLAQNSLQESLKILSKPENVIQLQSLVQGFAGKVLRSGPGTEPFMLVVHALRGILGESFESVEGDLLQTMARWDASCATAESKAFADRFLESDGSDPYFRAGDHMGGECENALFEFVDAALTLLTID